jgi:ADP-dependent phosphofructokinase/glucokinase
MPKIIICSDPYTVDDEKNINLKINKAELIAIESGLQLLAIEWKNDKTMKESVEDAHYTLTDLIQQEALGRSK